MTGSAPASAAEAKAAGAVHFFTGVPCRHGHLAPRFTSGGRCTTCVKERNARWYQDNAEQAKATRSSWRQLNADKDRADVAKYRAENIERIKQAQAAWNQKNRDLFNGYAASYRSRHHERTLKSGAEWRAKNPDKVNAKKAARRAAILRATPIWANEFFIAEAYHLAKVRERVCGGSWHVDHIVPLKSKLVCGLHCEANLQVIPGRENLSKSNLRWPDMPA